jgi:hypothetical protein
MAKLHEYAATSDSSGFYIYGLLNNQEHTTIQVTDTAQRLFDYIDVNPGEKVPQNLLRALLDARLLYTGRGRIRQRNERVRFETDETKAELSDEQYQRLLQFIQSYDGPNNAALRKLADGLEISQEEIPPPQNEDLKESSGLPEGIKEIALEHFSTREDRLKERLGPKLNETAGNATVDDISQLSGGWEVIDELFSFEGSIEELDVLEEQRIRYQVRLPSQEECNETSVFTIIQDTPRLTGSDTARFTVIADRTVSLPPEREFNITHRIQIGNNQILDWTITGKIGVHIPVETAKGSLKGDRDQIFRELQKLSRTLTTFELSHKNPYEVDLDYAIEDLPL